MEFSEIKEWVGLSLVPEVGPKRFISLLNHFDSPEKVFSASLKELEQIPDIGRVVAKSIKDFNLWDEAEKQSTRIVEEGINFITLNSGEYPVNLKNIYDPPPYLFLKGELKKEDNRALAIIGTRTPSAYGKLITEKITKELVEEGITIISGFARGIDSISHHYALESKGRTIGVLGSGLDVIYPPENKSLAERIVKNGALLSEFLLGTKPEGTNFPKRNRLISGLSFGVVIIEAGMKSGALLTAKLALDQGREVFAIPGNISSLRSEGTNWLIKEGAKLVTRSVDILEELKSVLSQDKKELRKEEEYPLSDKEQKVYQLLSAEPAHIDLIAEESELATPTALSVLLNLELKGLVRQLSGKNFIRVQGR
ncbi:MAG: DNA-processing protein DprA [candidate division Zixibacteria bacterium]|nr:DNA-processing protein DprA [candidate division Zixibacteria bacterium]